MEVITTVHEYQERCEKLNKEDDKISLFDSLDIEYQEKIVDTKKLDEEIRKNDEFLKALKDFRKNLD